MPVVDAGQTGSARVVLAQVAGNGADAVLSEHHNDVLWNLVTDIRVFSYTAPERPSGVNALS